MPDQSTYSGFLILALVWFGIGCAILLVGWVYRFMRLGLAIMIGV